MIFLDLETTALTVNALRPIAEQPEILECYAVKADDKTLKLGEAVHFLARPRSGAVPDTVTKITGLTWDHVKEAKTFAAHLPGLARLFLGESTLVAHHVSYDVSVLGYELERIGQGYHFPWPPVHLCTIEATRHLFRDKFPTLVELHQKLFGRPPKDDQHRARNDVLTLHACFRELRKRAVM